MATEETQTLPDRVLIFKKGVNKTAKGNFLFDDAAATEVMSDFEEHGNDVMFDLEHMSCCPDSVNYNTDAMAWCQLEVDDAGDLYATGVTWTPEGASRLASKKQRYVSPTFDTMPLVNDDGSMQPMKRITSIFNVAITSMPATFSAPQLVAANRFTLSRDLFPKTPMLFEKKMKAPKTAVKLAADPTTPVDPAAVPSPEEMAQAISTLQDQLKAAMKEIEDLKAAVEKDNADDAAGTEDVAASEDPPAEDDSSEELSVTKEALATALSEIDTMKRETLLTSLHREGKVDKQHMPAYKKLSFADLTDIAKTLPVSPRFNKPAPDAEVKETRIPGTPRKPLVLSLNPAGKK